MASIVQRAIGDPLVDGVDCRLIQEGPALRHAVADDTRGAFEFPDEVAVVGVTRRDAVDARHLDAGDIDRYAPIRESLVSRQA